MADDTTWQALAQQAAQPQPALAAPILPPQLPAMALDMNPYPPGYPQQVQPAQRPQAHVQQMVNALRLAQFPQLGAPVAPAIVHPAYAPAPANLNPNLAKEKARIQQVATGIAKPNQADWGQ